MIAYVSAKVMIKLNGFDRWGRTALDDAKHFGRQNCADLLEELISRTTSVPTLLNGHSGSKLVTKNSL